MIVKLLKKLGIYTPVKRLRDDILYTWRDNLYFGEDMLHMYKQFINKGDLVFDLGTAYGKRTRYFLKLGARVVMVEPTSYYQNKINRRFGKNKDVTIIKAGIADVEGEQEITLCSAPTLSSFDEIELNDVKSNPQMRNLEFDKKEKVRMITLNYLIETYGMPNFVKLDIEGYEMKAFSTLKYAIPKLSFEYHAHFKEKCLQCIDYLSALGNYEFNYSIKESMKFALGEWCDVEKIKQEIQNLNPDTDFGDCYLKLKEESK